MRVNDVVTSLQTNRQDGLLCGRSGVGMGGVHRCAFLFKSLHLHTAPSHTLSLSHTQSNRHAHTHLHIQKHTLCDYSIESDTGGALCLHDGRGLVFVFVGTVLHRAGALEGHQASVSGAPAGQQPPAAQHAQELFSHVLAA